jgi:hypothetical protein
MSEISVWRAACRCALSDGIPRRSFFVALVVGGVLNLINQGDALLAGRPFDWLKIVLTFAVPYCVSTYGAVSYSLRVSRRSSTARLPPEPTAEAPELSSPPAATPDDGYSRRSM